jgi:hypothetical protein
MQKMVNVGTEVVDGFCNKTLVFSASGSQYGNLTYTIDSPSGSANPRPPSLGLEVNTLVAESG